MNYNFNYEHFRELIIDFGYKSEKNFFEKTNTPKSTFVNIKNGTCDLSTVKRLCGILKCEITDLFPSERLLDVKNESYVPKVKKIAVLSAATGVGVTTFSVNLAQMLEKRKHKTLIVEIGDSSSFDILEIHNRRTEQITTIIGDSFLKIKRHGVWLDSLRLTDNKYDTSINISNEKGVNLELANLKTIFEELVKKNHYVYIIFSCRGFPFHTLIEKELDTIYGQEQLVKLADIALVGFDITKVKIEKATSLINWLCDLNIEVFITQFMHKKKNLFINTREVNNEEIAYFDQNLYNKYKKDRKEYFEILNNIVGQNKKLHMVEQYLTYFGAIDLKNLGKSIFTIDDSKLKKNIISYKYQVKNIFEEIDSFEREFKR